MPLFGLHDFDRLEPIGVFAKATGYAAFLQNFDRRCYCIVMKTPFSYS